ncbi:YbeD family protein [Congregibacter sp.]|uniref:YbeD family protein n=1 Tax=Congregibacter sp. TaxID=2744308 RepID=UPI003F6C449F
MAELITGKQGSEGEEPPKIEFPCDYPVKVLGRNVTEFRPLVLEIFERHAPGFDQSTITVRDSRKGNFLSMTIIITATGPEQLESIHQDLRATGIVQMVL